MSGGRRARGGCCAQRPSVHPRAAPTSCVRLAFQANSVDYGLGSSVFSKDYARAERIAARLVTGMCNVNDYGVNYLCQSLPFGGVNVRRAPCCKRRAGASCPGRGFLPRVPA